MMEKTFKISRKNNKLSFIYYFMINEMLNNRIESRKKFEEGEEVLVKNTSRKGTVTERRGDFYTVDMQPIENYDTDSFFVGDLEKIKNSRGNKMEKYTRNYSTKLVKDIMSGAISEEKACEIISRKENCNIKYASVLLNNWISDKKDMLLASGVEDVASELDKDFDIDGDIYSWSEDYIKDNGETSTIGGELLVAYLTLLNGYTDDENIIGHSTDDLINASARYLIEHTDIADDIQQMLDGELVLSADEYYQWLTEFEKKFTDYLRDNEVLFNQEKLDSIVDYISDEDDYAEIDECYVLDNDGNKYWFDNENGAWTCKDIEFVNEAEKQVDDEFDENDPFALELDHEDEFGSFDKDGFIYDFEAVGEADEYGEYHEWKITRISVENQFCEIGDTKDIDDVVNVDGVYDAEGKELSDKDFEIQSSLVKSDFFDRNNECIIEINDGSGWEFVSLDRDKGWSTEGKARVFPNEETARKSILHKKLNESGYSEEFGNLKFSNN